MGLKRAQAGFWWSDRIWSHSVASGRYIDDVIWLSRSLCAGCMAEGIAQAYSVPFEIEPPINGKLVWLDFVICLHTFGAPSERFLSLSCHGLPPASTLSASWQADLHVGGRCNCCQKIWPRLLCIYSVTSRGLAGKKDTSANPCTGSPNVSLPTAESLCLPSTLASCNDEFCCSEHAQSLLC